MLGLNSEPLAYQVGTILNYSQTSLRAPPLGVDLTGCYTQVSILSRLSQKCHFSKKVVFSKLTISYIQEVITVTLPVYLHAFGI